MGVFKDLFGDKPDIPDFPQVDTSESVRKTVSANTANLPAASALASSVNKFSREQLLESQSAALPGFEKIRGNIGRALVDLTQGKLPDDVQRAVSESTAFRASRAGFGGSPAQTNLTARDLGRTSLQLVMSGLEATQRWLAATQAPTFDVTSQFITPGQQLQTDQFNARGAFEAATMQAQVDAAPDPVSRGLLATGLEIADLFGGDGFSLGGLKGIFGAGGKNKRVDPGGELDI